MKRKVILLFLVIAILLSTVTLAAIKNNNEKKEKILTGDKLESISESYKKIETKEKDIDDVKNIVNLASEYLKVLNSDFKELAKEKIDIKQYDNLLDSKIETVISNEANSKVYIDCTTGEVIGGEY